jgi:hypothetical protein
MESLAEQPQIRSAILVVSTGVRPAIALRKSVRSSAEDLDIALREEQTDAETVVGLFDRDDRVRYLDRQLLWAFLEEGSFWETPATDAGYEVVRAHLSFLLDRALGDGLIEPRDVVGGVGIDELAELLPRPELARVLHAALKQGRDGVPFTDAALLVETPIDTLTRHVPLPHLWERIVVPRIAEANDFVTRRAAASPRVPVVDGHAKPASAEPARVSLPGEPARVSFPGAPAARPKVMPPAGVRPTPAAVPTPGPVPKSGGRSVRPRAR